MMKNIFKVIFVVVGTMIGAGFASGKEIYVFFFQYGIQGLLGILISSILIGIITYKTLKIIKENNIETYKDFLNALIKSKSKNKYFNIKNIINIVINIFIIITFFIMVAGFGAFFEQELGINSLIGSSILSILCFIVFMTSIKGVVKTNEILIPILITFLTIIGIINLKDINILEISNYILQTTNNNFILSAIVYSSYNSILLIPILITVKKYLKSNKEIKIISIISTVIIILLAILVYMLLIRVNVNISELEMPAVYVITNVFTSLKYVYGFIILGSIFTTAILLGASFLQNTAKSKKSYTQISIIMCIIAVLVSRIGFSNLINLLYPIFGYLGLIQIVKIIIQREKTKRIKCSVTIDVKQK